MYLIKNILGKIFIYTNSHFFPIYLHPRSYPAVFTNTISLDDPVTLNTQEELIPLP